MLYGTEGLRTTILLISCMGVWAGHLYGIALLASQENKRTQLNAYAAAAATASMLSVVLDMSEPSFSSLSVNIKMACTSLVIVLESLLVSASLCMRKTGHVPLLRQLRRMSRLGWSIPLSHPHVQGKL